MHPKAYQLWREMIDKHVFENLSTPDPLNVLDVGSYDLNGTLKPLIVGRGWQYTGLDLVEGPNVDVVTYPYQYPLPRDHFDLVISNATIEHVQDLRQWFRELRRVCKPDGLIITMGPVVMPEHGSECEHNPVDFWRILPDGMRLLMKDAGLLVCAIVSTPEYCAGIGMKV